MACKHLNAKVHAGNRMGEATCPDCHQPVRLVEVINNLLDEAREIMKAIKGEIARDPH